MMRWAPGGRIRVVLFALALVMPAWAQDRPTVALAVDPTSGTVGDVFTATITVEAPQTLSLILPGRDADLGDAEVLGFDIAEDTVSDGLRRVTLRYQLTFWEVGERKVLAPPIAWSTADDEAVKHVDRPEATVTIRSVLPPQAEDIRDIRGPREIPLRWYHYAMVLLPPLVLFAIVAALVHRLRRRASEAEPEVPAPPLPPHEEALQALDRLAAEDLAGQGRIEEHYVRLSWIVRNYIERRWALPALETTTSILAETMRGSGRVPEAAATATIALLRRADLAKFAKHRPAVEVARADIDEARVIVQSTRPPEPVEPEGER